MKGVFIMAETTKKEKIEMDFNKLTAKMMKEYIEEHHDNTESKKAFRKAAFVEKTEKTAVTVYEADGKPKVYVDKNGKTRVKKKMIDVAGGEKKEKFNLLKAKKYFYNEYKDEINFINPPKESKKDKKQTEADKLFGNW